MPWTECHVVDERLRFVARRPEGKTMTALARGADAAPLQLAPSEKRGNVRSTVQPLDELVLDMACPGPSPRRASPRARSSRGAPPQARSQPTTGRRRLPAGVGTGGS
jgi:hypothetical protein